MAGILPGFFQVAGEVAFCCQHFLGRGDTAALHQRERVQKFADDVDLALVGGFVAQADRGGAFIAGQPVEVRFVQAAVAVHPVHDPHLVRVGGDRA